MLFFPDGTSLLLADERSVRLHDARTGRQLREFLGHEGSIGGMAISADGRTLATASGTDGKVKWWHIPTGQHLTDFPAASTENSRCAFSEDDAWFAYSFGADVIRCVNVK